jgi:hypothetical protein
VEAGRRKARGSSDLVSRDTQQAQRHQLWLDFAQAGHIDTEHRLSRLCAWVLQADGWAWTMACACRAGDPPRQRRGAQAPLPGGPGPVLNSLRQKLTHLPRLTEGDTLFPAGW